MAKTKVAVLFGGVSSEHEISLMTAANIIENIPRVKYDVISIGITKKGRWLFYPGGVDLIRSGEWEKSPDCCSTILSPDFAHNGFIKLMGDDISVEKVDVIFPALHGKNGEDGTIQGLLTLSGIPYVGSGTLASAACMDKEVTHTILESCGIHTARWLSITRSALDRLNEFCESCIKTLGLPLFVKPANCGSSIGISKVTVADDLPGAVKRAFTHDRKVLVEEMIVGKELECAVKGNDTLFAPLVGEIAPASEFYDFEGKYVLDTTEQYIPARIPEHISSEIREIAMKAYRALGCAGLARVDFFLRSDGTILLNEINTIPGFTNISMYPKLMEAAGIPYPQLLDDLLELAQERAERA